MNFNQAAFDHLLLVCVDQLPKSGLLEKIEVAFAGRSNVGKSSLYQPAWFIAEAIWRGYQCYGSWQDWRPSIFIRWQVVFTLWTLPGYGYAKVAQYRKAMRWSRARLRGISRSDRRYRTLVVQLIDMRRPPTKLTICK